MRRLRSIIAPLICGFLLVACGGPDDPRELAAAYLDDLAAGRLDAAFDRLAPRIQERLAGAEAAWARGEDDPLSPAEPAPADFRRAGGRGLFARLLAGAPGAVPLIPADAAQRVGPVRREGLKAHVEITTPLGKRELTLERVDDEWVVLLRLPG